MASNSSRLTTCALWRIVECPSPHSSAHTTGNSPVRSVVVTRMCVSIPGTASIFIRKAGTQKSWITSLDWTVKLTGVLAGS